MKDLFTIDVNKRVHISLNLMHYMEDGTHMILSPALQLSGHGDTYEQAKKAFDETLEIWLDFVTYNSTLHQDLTRLGWHNEDAELIENGLDFTLERTTTYHPPTYDIEQIKQEYEIQDVEVFEVRVAA